MQTYIICRERNSEIIMHSNSSVNTALHFWKCRTTKLLFCTATFIAANFFLM